MLLNEKAKAFMGAAMEALQTEILEQVRNQKHAEGVPCEDGVRRFADKVSLYWRLCELTGLPHSDAMAVVSPEATCQVAPDRY